MKKTRGFSLIEAVMVILIAGILAAVGGSIMAFTLQNAVYSPKALNMGMLTQEAVDKITDGDHLAKGLRFSRQITNAGANTVTYIDQDNKTVVITLNTGTGRLSRSINAAADSNFLYYQNSADISFTTGRNGALFLYYDASENTTATAANVRRIAVNLIARTSSGAFANWQGQSEQSSSVRVPKFQ